jgi:hypothetical protein
MSPVSQDGVAAVLLLWPSASGFGRDSAFIPRLSCRGSDQFAARLIQARP